MKVKFCGIRRPEDVKAVNRLHPDFIGFVFAKSKRQVTVPEASVMKNLLAKGIKTVAVLVNMPAEEAAELANSGIADLLQLHGEEDAPYIARLKMLTDAKIIKAIRLRDGAGAANSNRRLLAEAAQADYYLFDTWVPHAYGGTGKMFPLSLLKGLPLDKPFFLAGGLDADHVSDVMRQLREDTKLCRYFFGVDVSGGIESNGNKDPAKMECFIREIRKRIHIG